MKKLLTVVIIILIIFSIKDIVASPWTIILFIIVAGSAIYSSLKKKKKSNKKVIKSQNQINNLKINTKQENTYTYNVPKINYTYNPPKINYQNENSVNTNIEQNVSSNMVSEKSKIDKIKQMKSLRPNFSINKNDRDKELFYRQASFMEFYEDDYDINVPYKTGQPNFTDMNTYQLRSYFSFRTLIRKNIYQKTQSTYIYLYLCEIINLIGVTTPNEGIEKLLEFWNNYRSLEPSLDEIMEKFIKDFYIVHNIQIPYTEIVKEFPIKKEIINNELITGNYNQNIEVFDNLSSYHILQSKLMEHKYAFVTEMVLPKVFENLDIYFNKNGYNFNEILFGRFKKVNYIPFEKAIFYNQNKSAEYQIKTDETYEKINDFYTKEELIPSENTKKLMGYILKNVDISLRDALKINNTLKVNNDINIKDQNLYNFITTDIPKLIDATIKKYLIEHKQEINHKLNEQLKENIKIDESQFNNIRESSNRVQEKLIVEEYEQIKEEIKETTIEKTSDNIYQNFINNLTEQEFEFMKLIMTNKTKNDLIEYSKSVNILFEIMIENINSKALETIEDNIMEDTGTEVLIYAEYYEQIKDIIGG